MPQIDLNADMRKESEGGGQKGKEKRRKEC